MTRSRPLIVGLLGILLLVSCKKETVRKEFTIGNETLNVMMPTSKEVVHPVHGKESWFGLGSMGGEGKTNANGVAQAHVFADNTTTTTVNLNIQPAPKGSHLVAWLQKPGTIERVRLDVLQNPLNDVRHVITVDIDKDLRAYTDVVVTLEKASGYSDTDPVYAKGTLKQRKR
ncbi:hypothetical protein EXS70_00800 [Candidatus Peribacteria bacterium]|nr:hypothetical protein [Candidatus Peribacteria bacterium]